MKNVKLNDEEIYSLIYLLTIRIEYLQNKCKEYEEDCYFLYDNATKELTHTKELLEKINNIIRKEK